VAPTNEVRFRNLTIPAPAFLEQKLAHEAFLPPMRRIGDALGTGASLESEPRPVWLSKSRMGINSVAHIANEAELEEILVSFEFDIVYPEQLTLPQQIDLFSNRQNIFGFAGSAFHNHIFSRQRPRITCITLDKFINTNFLILDKLNASDTRYLYPFDNIENIEISG
jgi:capsular polysaccharide biosynthesis protein